MGRACIVKVGFICGAIVMVTLCTWVKGGGLRDCVLGGWFGALTGSKEL